MIKHQEDVCVCVCVDAVSIRSFVRNIYD